MSMSWVQPFLRLLCPEYAWSAAIALFRLLSHQYWVNFSSLGYIVPAEMAISQDPGLSLWIFISSLRNPNEGKLPIIPCAIWALSTTQERLGLQTDNWPSCRMRLRGKSGFACSWPVRDHKSAQYLQCSLDLFYISRASALSHLQGWKEEKSLSGFLTSPFAVTKPSLCWLQPTPMSHGQSSQEQPSTAKKHSLINHPEKTTSSFVSPSLPLL